MTRERKLLIFTALFAVAMAYMESAVVVYLRAMYGIEDLLRDVPQTPDLYTAIEIGREISTLVMLVMVGWIAGRRFQDRIGYAMFTFGLWDIFYYIWLHVFLGWPDSLLVWDILFLIPLPWWGPVLSPVLIALLMMLAGVVLVLKAEEGKLLRISRLDLGITGAGILLALYVFMADAIHALPGGFDAVSRVQPTDFNWLLFLLALAGMAYFPLKAAMKK